VSLHPPPKSAPPKRLSWGDPQAIAILIAGVLGAVAVIVAALISSDVVNVTIGGPSTSPPGPVPQPTPVPVPTPTPTSPTPDPTPTPTVRRSTGNNPMTLTDGYAVDLDTPLNAAWDVEYAATLFRFDMSFHRDVGIRVGSKSDISVVDGPASYETCSNATGYAQDIPQKEVQQGVAACVRTSEKRLAFFTIKKITPRDFPRQIQLDVTVWDPPSEE
jgi:hypothetical protein